MVNVQTFIGMKNARQTIDAIIAGHSPIHAVLLYGAVGAGKTLLAERLVQFWLCTAPTDQGACGQCDSCRGFLGSGAVDFQRITPQGASRIIRQGMITGDPPEDDWPGIPVRQFFRTRPLMARHKVVLIEEADRLNGPAANGLLKTLEEPGPHARVILMTSSVSRILPTVVSRCVAIACELAGDVELNEQLGPIEEHERVFSEGAPGMVQRIRKHQKAYQGLWTALEAHRSSPRGAALLAAEQFREAADKLGDALDQGARAGNTEALRCLALWVANRMPERRGAVQATIEAHRRVIGNASFPLASDALFVTLLR